MAIRTLHFFLIVILAFKTAFSQTDIVGENLILHSYSQLKESYLENYNNSDLAILYAQAFLSKAKLENKSIKIAEGYDYLARHFDIETNLMYCDSIIIYSKNLRNQIYPAGGYLLKGYWFYKNGDYKKSLRNYLAGHELAIINDNRSQLITSKQAIGALKNRWGNYKEALAIYKELLDLIEKDPNSETGLREDHLISLYNVALGFQRNILYDSAQVYLERGYRLSKDYNDSIMLRDFTSVYAINKYYQKEFPEALDSLLKVEEKISGTSLAINNYYQGLIALKSDTTEAIRKFEAVDSIFQETQDEFPELRNAYENLVSINEDQNNIEAQLKYIKKLIVVDSLLDGNREYINYTIATRYDTPSLKRKIKEINASLNYEKNKRRFDLVVFIGIFIILGVSIIFQYRKKSRYKKRLAQLLNNNFDGSNPKLNTLNGSKRENLGIKDDVVKRISEGLKSFEKNKSFKQKKLTAISLAKQLKTNSSYLSKVINSERGKNFSQYINDLRIDYLISELKNNNSLYRNYTIEALGLEIGFGNTDSFTKAFKKRANVPISYFLKNIDS